MNRETKVVTSPTGDVEILMNLSGGTYQLVWERSYGKGVFNPDDTIENLIAGKLTIPRKNHKLLFGTHLNGACPADCTGCPFGRTVMKDHQVLARPIKPNELSLALNEAKSIALEKGILGDSEVFSAGSLLSGDSGYNHKTAQLIEVVSNFSGCKSSRWSTIAPVDGDVFSSFLEGAKTVKSAGLDHVLSFQTSLHSTNEQKRIEHTGVRRLLSVENISEAAKKIFETTGRKMTMAFVLHRGSEIDPIKLEELIPAAVAIVSLRGMKTDRHPLMNADDQVALYRKFRNIGRDVVFMPASPDALELDNMRTRF